MVLLGIVSFFQITFIPGFIFLKLLGFRHKTRAEAFVLSFALSLYINYMLVYLLTLAGIYNTLTMFIILGLEAFLLVFVMVREGGLTLSLSFYRDAGSLHQILFWVSVLLTIGFLYFFFSNLGSIFSSWDPVLSWNRWALDWYNNRLPAFTDYYPQLIPANWSIAYTFTQNGYMQLFAKAIMPLFPLFVLLLFLDLYLKKRRTDYLVALILYASLILIYAFDFIRTGYVDIAASFFMFLTLYLILIFGRDITRPKNMLITVLCASAATLTKQAGIILLVFALVFITWHLLGRKIRGKQLFSRLAILYTVPLFSLLWYLQKILEINWGQDVTHIGYLAADIHRGRNLLERLVYGITNLNGGIPLFSAIMVLAVLGIAYRKSRIITITLTICLILLWGTLFSYDSRNFFITLPFIAYSSSHGIIYLIHKLNINLKPEAVNAGKKTIRAGYRVLLISSAAVIIALALIPASLDQSLEAQQIMKQKMIGNSQINQSLYEYKKDYEIDGRILTDYYWATALPGFEGKDFRIFKENNNFVILSNGVYPTNFFELIDDNTFGLLISDRYYFEPGFNQRLEENISRKKFSIIFSKHNYHFIKVNGKK
ncbi:MAG: hypothetical protein ACQEP5_10185 [Actinomycetota bacterium]